MRTLALTAAAAILLSGQAIAAPRLIYRVDSASAVIVQNHLVITANGAVDSGGWSKPELLIQKPSAFPEPKALKTKFVAKPPASRDSVVQALLPIHVRKVAPLPAPLAR